MVCSVAFSARVSRERPRKLTRVPLPRFTWSRDRGVLSYPLRKARIVGVLYPQIQHRDLCCPIYGGTSLT